MAEIQIRNAVSSDLHEILDIAKSVGRYIGYEDELQSWFCFDPEGFFVAESLTGENKRILIGVCVGIALTADRGFIGLYATREEFRGCGIGSRLWDAAKTRLGDRNIGICGRDVHFDKFKQKGFRFCKNYSILYYETTNCTFSIEDKNLNNGCKVTIISLNGRQLYKDFSSRNSKEMRADVQDKGLEDNLEVNTAKDIRSDNLNPCKKYLFEPEVINIVIDDLTGISLTPEDLINGVVKYDGDLHGYDRSFIVKNTFSWGFCKTKVALSSNRVVGYGCFRSVVTGDWLVSPLYADSVEIAECILHALLREVDSCIVKSVILRVPDTNTSFCKLLERLGFTITDTRILSGFTKEYIRIDESKIYSMHSTVFCSE